MDYDLPDGGASPEEVEDVPPSPSTTTEPPGPVDPSPGPDPDLLPVEERVVADAPEEPAGVSAPPVPSGEPACGGSAARPGAGRGPHHRGRARSAHARPLPRVIAIANQKGGVGKTTTAVNLGACLAELGYRTLVVDLDPQGNATTGLGINTRALEASMYDVLLGETPIEDCIEGSSVRNLFVAPASLDLAGAEIELVPAFSRELRLRNAIDAVKDDYDYVLIDCPPSLGLLTVNAFAAATEVLVPIQCEYYALEGLGQLVRNVDLVKRNLNDRLEISTIILVMYDARTKLADQVATEVREHFGEKVCRTDRAPHGAPLRGAVVRSADHHVRSELAGAPSPTGSWPRRSAVGRRSGLGKGLGALIPATERLEDTDAALRELPVSEISAQLLPAARALRRGGARQPGRIDPGRRGAAAGPGAPDRTPGVRAHRRGATLARAPGGPGSRRSRPSCAPPRTSGPSSRPWSRTSIVRT